MPETEDPARWRAESVASLEVSVLSSAGQASCLERLLVSSFGPETAALRSADMSGPGALHALAH